MKKANYKSIFLVKCKQYRDTLAKLHAISDANDICCATLIKQLIEKPVDRIYDELPASKKVEL